jgi:serine O-acetyltransferase
MTKTPTISATEADWTREAPRRFWDPSRRLLRSLRAYQAARLQGGVLGKVLQHRWALSHRFWSVITQAEIPLNAQIEGGLMMPHPNGVVIHPRVRIGPNCIIFQQVTLGSSKGGVPTLGGHVDVSAGAKILGGVIIGEHALIGANAVVIHDAPAWAVVAGVPAKVIGDRRADALVSNAEG